jgi:hypothetical protein
VRSWLLSALRQQYAAKGRKGFVESAAPYWLLWEPGAWRPPQRRTRLLPVLVRGSTAAAPRQAPAAATAEALAIELEAGAKPVVLGRGTDCDVVVNDGTLSARHLALHWATKGWQVEDLGSTNGTRVNDVEVTAGVRVTLPMGARLEAGQVALSLYAAEDLWRRLSQR